MLLFTKANRAFVGYFDKEVFFKIVKIIIFRYDLTDISAKKEPLLGMPRGPLFKRCTIRGNMCLLIFKCGVVLYSSFQI